MTSQIRPAIVSFVLLTLLTGVIYPAIVTGIAHTFFADQTARQIGWATGSPFQFEVAMANLGIGVCGLLCYRFRDGFSLRRRHR